MDHPRSRFLPRSRFTHKPDRGMRIRGMSKLPEEPLGCRRIPHEQIECERSGVLIAESSNARRHLANDSRYWLPDNSDEPDDANRPICPGKGSEGNIPPRRTTPPRWSHAASPIWLPGLCFGAWCKGRSKGCTMAAS